jgi:hypothetical protein
VVTVLFLLLLTAVLVTACVAAVWPRSGGSPGASGRPGRSKIDSESRAPTTASQPISLEGVLVRQLATGEVTRRQYLRTMENLAARDDECHPMSVPTDGGSSETGK